MKKGHVVLIFLTSAFLCILLGIYIGRNTVTLIPTVFSSNSKPAATGVNPENRGKININTATVSQLQLLPEIGEVLAQSIIEYREENGPFNTIDDLLKVNGIGTYRLNLIKDRICISD